MVRAEECWKDIRVNSRLRCYYRSNQLWGADVVYVLGRMRQRVIDRKKNITGEWAEVDLRIFSLILAIYTVAGQIPSEAVVAKVIRLSGEKYCRAPMMLSKTAKITRGIPKLETA